MNSGSWKIYRKILGKNWEHLGVPTCSASTLRCSNSLYCLSFTKNDLRQSSAPSTASLRWRLISSNASTCLAYWDTGPSDRWVLPKAQIAALTDPWWSCSRWCMFDARRAARSTRWRERCAHSRRPESDTVSYRRRWITNSSRHIRTSSASRRRGKKGDLIQNN